MTPSMISEGWVFSTPSPHSSHRIRYAVGGRVKMILSNPVLFRWITSLGWAVTSSIQGEIRIISKYQPSGAGELAQRRPRLPLGVWMLPSTLAIKVFWFEHFSMRKVGHRELHNKNTGCPWKKFTSYCYFSVQLGYHCCRGHCPYVKTCLALLSHWLCCFCIQKLHKVYWVL